MRCCSQACSAALRHGKLTRDTIFQYCTADPDTGCWNWGRKTHNGRGYIWHNGRKTLAYRAVYEVFKEPVPAHLFACHKCDNPRCVNPDHIFIGTAGDNSRDAGAKGRLPHGEKHPHRRLTESRVREIRQKRAAGERIVSLARDYSVSVGVINRIVARETWKHVV